MKKMVSDSFSAREILILADILTKLLRNADSSIYIRTKEFKSLARKVNRMSGKVRGTNGEKVSKRST